MKNLLFALLALACCVVNGANGQPRPSQQPVDAFVTVNGVKLHYVDWGGRGDPLLLLPGYGDDAHVFDAFAPALTDSFHVYGLTRRGVGKSDWPTSGYDTATRVEDVRGLLDHLRIRKVNLVGHSMAGDELTLFASKYPRRVRRMVYLDAAHDRSRLVPLLLSDPVILPMWKRLLLESQDAPEASAIQVNDMPPPDEWRVMVATYKGMIAFNASYGRVRCPALAIYAEPAEHPMAAQLSDAADRERGNRWWSETAIAWIRASEEQFKRETKRGELLVLPNAHHYVFNEPTRDQVVALVRAFLLR